MLRSVLERSEFKTISLSKPNGVLKNHIFSRLQIHTHTYRDVMYVFTQQQQQQQQKRKNLSSYNHLTTYTCIYIDCTQKHTLVSHLT